MKNSPNRITLLAFATLLLLSINLTAQEFQRAFGDALDNTFSKVIQDASGNFYVLGQNEAVNNTPLRATVTRLDANGQHQWTLSLNFASQWQDAVLTPSGELMVVGHTLPLDPTSKAIMARVTAAGAFARLRTYDEAGRDILTRIVRQSGAFPYYVIGAQYDGGASPTYEDVVLFNMDQDLNINFKKRYYNPGDDEYFRDFESLGANTLAMAGNWADGLIFISDNGGNISAGVQLPNRLVKDIHKELFGGVYAASTNGGNTEAYVEKFDANLFLLWEYRIDGLTSISQVWEGLPGSGELYAVGVGNFGGQQRTVVVKLVETINDLTVAWVKYLTVGSGYTGGSAWFLNSVNLAFTDARTIPGGFGQNCAFVSVSGLEMETCEVGTSTTTLTQTDPFPNSPQPFPFVETAPITMGVNSVEASALNWQQQVACSTEPCEVSLAITPQNNCGLVQVCANPTGPGPYSYQWCSGENTPCITTQIPSCSPFEFCVSVTCSDGTVATAIQTYTVVDITPPTALCSGVGIDLDANCQATITPGMIDGGSSDNCQIASMTVSPGVVTGCGLHPVTLTVTDWCGNVSTCSTSVQTIEVTPPNIVCPPSKTVACNANTGPNNCGFATATDNCDPNPVITHVDVTSGAMPCDGVIQRTWTAEDNCGNVSSCVQNITVFDNVGPVITNCSPNQTVTGTIGPNGQCTANVQVASPSISDNCDQNPTLTNSFNNTANASGTYPQGTTTVTWTAVDDCMNVATCSFTVTVQCPPSSIFKCGMAVFTCFSGLSGGVADPNGKVIALVDIRNHASAPLGVNWHTASSGIMHGPTWDSKTMGQVFGVTIDKNYNIYASSSTIYGKYLPPTPPTGGFGNVYKIDASTGVASTLATLPQAVGNPAGLGDVWYDEVNDQLFVSNFFDGLIYRINPNSGLTIGTPYDYPGTALGTPSPGFIPRGERVWAVATHNNRLYFSVWIEDRARQEPTRKNQIWSVQLDGSGAPMPSSLQHEKDLPDLTTLNSSGSPTTQPYSSPVSDITFSETGLMLVAERSINNDFGDVNLSPGSQAHASRVIELSGANWSGEKLIHVGNPSPNHLHSAGGIDYGYESFDPATSTLPMLCDSMIWSTGDALRFPAHNAPKVDLSPLPCGGGTGDYVYGLAGMPQRGNSNLPIPANDYVKNSSIYIDADNVLCYGEKIQIGDVDVFKNCINCTQAPTVPCDSLMVMLKEDPPGNQCCFKVDVKNNFGPSISKLQIDLCTPGIYFNTSQISVAAGFQFAASNNDNTLCVTHTSGSIPPGFSSDIIRFCYGGTSGPGTFPQTLKFTWFQNVGGVDVATNCIDTTHTDCVIIPPKDPCVAVTPLNVACNPANVFEYILTFKVTNLSTTPSFNAYTVNLYGLPPGFTFAPCVGPGSNLSQITIPIPGAPLAPTQMSGNMCVKIVSSTPILSPQTICVRAKLIGIEACCMVDDKFCFTIEPCCDPCENIAITTAPVHQGESECCYSLGLINNCPYPFFTKIEAEITTGGVTYGYQALNPALLGFWTIANSTNTKLCIEPTSGTVPAGTINDLASFCLDNINNASQVPQTIVVRWITKDANGQDSVACDTTLIFDCPFPVDYKCLAIDSINIECLPDQDKYQLTFTVTNHSLINFCATSLDFIQLAPADLIFSPSSSYLFPTPLCQGQSQTVTICLFDTDGLPGGGSLVFIPKLSFNDGDTCCYEGMPVTIPLPPCDSCVCTPPNLTMTTTSGSSIPLTCNLTDQTLWPSLACQAGNVTISGTLGCTSLAPGADCPPSTNWFLSGPNGPISSGSINSGTISLTFPASQVSAPGDYTFVTTTFCPGALEACACYIYWKQEDCDSCICEQPSLTLTQSGVDYFLACTQGAPTPALACPADNITITGNFGCVSENTGMPCAPTPVTWNLVGPAGPVGNGILPNNSVALSFTASQTAASGTYFLTLSTLCPGATDSCICVSRFIRLECDTCCTDEDEFNTLVAQGFTVVTDPAQCKVTVSAPQFDSCHWFTTPPHLQGANVPQVITDPSGMWMFNFTQSGSYTICVIVYEENANGEICWQKEMCTTVDISCNNACVCGDFTGMYWRPTQGTMNQPIMCGQELTLGCLQPGFNVQFGGDFNCIGNNCTSTVSWVLREKVSQIPVLSNSATGPNFQILIPESSFVYPTVYELVFTAACNGVVCDSCVFTIITTECPCHCGQFDKIFMRTTKGAPSIAMQCGGDAVPVGCPLPGQPMQFTGLFQCDGPDCPDSALVSWRLVRLPSTTVATGNTKADPFFGVSIMPLWYTTPGMYELQLSGYCGFDTCTCSVKFEVNCSNACPCDPLDFIADLNRGFSTTLFETTSCFACFSPISLSDCDMVEWSVNGVSTGTTVGEAMFFYTFTATGIYEIKMHATRFSSDGSVCHFADFIKSISITCPFELGCTGGVLPNPTFSQDAMEGILGVDGTSLGWGSAGGAPVVVEGGPNTNDGWTIELSGNFDTSDVLTTLEPICLEKATGMLTLDRGIKENGIRSVLVIAFYRGDDFDLNDCDGSVCFEIDAKAESDRPYKDRVQFPYDLSAWAASDDCGDPSGVLVRPVVYAYNHLGFNQGGDETKTVIYIDNLCLDGQLVDLQEVSRQHSIHLYPNPTSHTLTLEFKGAAPKDGSIQILDLLGRLLNQVDLLPGQQKHQFSLEGLPAGMYFVRVTEGGIPIWSEKLIKQ